MKKYLGDKKFYRMVVAIVLPIIIQNGITNFVSLLDNIMVGRVGTEPMTGVAIANQLLFVFQLCIFGAVSGAGIFTAQFYGNQNHQGIRNTFRLKLIIGGILVVLGALIFYFGADSLISIFLKGDAGSGDPEATFLYGKQYMYVMLLSLLPNALIQAYASTLRECGETVVPMKASVVAVLVNLVLNYLLIFGNFGFPKLGVVGAAVATVISKVVETAVILYWTHRNTEKNPFIVGAYRSFRLPGQLVKNVIIKTLPLMINETLWAAGQAILMQCYSMRGLEVVAGLNICSTIANIFNIVYIAMGDAVAIIVGQHLGAGDMEKAKDTDRKLIFFSVASCFAVGVGMLIISPFFPKLYNTTDNVRVIAAGLIRVVGICMPLYAFEHAAYFTLRSGGNTLVTFFFDSLFVCVVSVPFAYVLSRYTRMPILTMYFTVQMVELIKCAIGFVLVKKGVWMNNIVGTQEES